MPHVLFKKLRDIDHSASIGQLMLVSGCESAD